MVGKVCPRKWIIRSLGRVARDIKRLVIDSIVQDLVEHDRVYRFYFQIMGKPMMESQNCKRSGPSIVIQAIDGNELGWWHERHREANRLVICSDREYRFLSIEWI